MKNKYLYSLLVIWILTGLSSVNAQYTMNTPYGNLTESDTMSRGPFMFWWDKDFNYAGQIDKMLDSMLVYRLECLGELGMQDPKSANDGYYCNIYIHTANNSSCYYSSNFPQWGNGVGQDSKGYAFMTLPHFVLGDWRNLAHETFHIFQTPGMWDLTPGVYNTSYGGWFVEATANWYAYQRYPENDNSFIESEILVRIPQVPIWLDFYNGPDYYPVNWQRDVHQYALSTYLYYLTHVVGIPKNTYTSMIYSGTDLTPQNYLFNQLGAENFRSYFIDCAAHMTNDFDFLERYQVEKAIAEWNWVADPTDDNKYVQTYDNTGSTGWFSPESEELTSAWSFNTYQLKNDNSVAYKFEINAETVGTFGDASFFQGKIVVQNSDGTSSFHNLIMEDDHSGSLILNLSSEDKIVYFVIASMPEVFVDYENEFQLFPYKVRITKEPIVGIDYTDNQTPKMEVARYNLLGQKINNTYNGLQFVFYNDGSCQKIYVNN